MCIIEDKGTVLLFDTGKLYSFLEDCGKTYEVSQVPTVPVNEYCLDHDEWPTFISRKTGMLQIGCQCHPIMGWACFRPYKISRMGFMATQFWEAHKEEVLNAALDYIEGICPREN